MDLGYDRSCGGIVQNQISAGRGLAKTATCAPAPQLCHQQANPFLLRAVYQQSPACLTMWEEYTLHAAQKYHQSMGMET